MFAQFASLMAHSAPQAIFLKLMHDKKLVDGVLYMLGHWGHVEFYGPALRNTLLSLPTSMLEVLVHQSKEILKGDPIGEVDAHDVPCILGMSRLDPLLNFEITRKKVEAAFRDVWVESNDHPYHQPPQPFTFEGLNRDYKPFLDLISATT
jgi:hypothetical protein